MKNPNKPIKSLVAFPISKSLLRHRVPKLELPFGSSKPVRKFRCFGNLPDRLWLLGSSIKENPCDYGLWCIRQEVVELLGAEAKSSELEFTKEILMKDVNNKYAWYHRKWVLKEFGGLEDELVFCNQLLEADSSNSSASNSSVWFQRFVAVADRPGKAFAEINYSIKVILENPENEHPWMYLRSLYKKYGGEEEYMIHRKLDNLFLNFFDDEVDGTLYDRSPVGRPSVDVIELRIVKHRRKVVYALEALIDLVYHGYDPLEINHLVRELCPTSKMVGFVESIRIILEFACPLRAPRWRWLTHRFHARREDLWYRHWWGNLAKFGSMVEV